MGKFYDLPQIKGVLKKLQPIQDIEEGFVAYSEGKAVIPPVGEILFKKPPGDVHIKYGYIVDDDYYVIKIASGLLIKVAFDQNHPIAYGMPEEAAAFFAHSPTFQTLPVLKEQEQPLVVGRYPEENIVLSGWMLGEKYL